MSFLCPHLCYNEVCLMALYCVWLIKLFINALTSYRDFSNPILFLNCLHPELYFIKVGKMLANKYLPCQWHLPVNNGIYCHIAANTGKYNLPP